MLSVSAKSASSEVQVVISHAYQRESLARDRLTGLAPLPAGEQLLERCHLAPAVRYLEHRADQGADHAVQEGVRRHPVGQQVAALLPGGLGNDPLESDVVGPRRREGPEVVGAPDELCGALQKTEVQFPGHVNSSSPLQRGADGGVDDAILVAPAFRVPASVEAPVSLHAASEREVLGSTAVALYATTGGSSSAPVSK